jgi:transcriptional regulator with XRE-family HTH domain
VPETFADKLALALKALSMTRARLASDLGVDKSVVGKWVKGTARPSAHNLARLSAVIARRVDRFNSLDWDLDGPTFSRLFGAREADAESREATGLPIRLLPEILASTKLRGSAYAGFYRSTRPFAAEPGRFIHDHAIVRVGDDGLMTIKMNTGGVVIDGWLTPLQDRVFCVASEMTSGSLVFGVLNGVGGLKVNVIDGIVLSAILDAGRTPTATAIIFHRIGDLGDDPQADEHRLAELGAADPVAPEGSVPEALANHLLRDVGPAAHAEGGDLFLRMPISRSFAR